MAAKVSEIFDKKFILVSGKGGSGKSMLALALAHRLTKEGKRVWLVELGRKKDQAFTRLPELVGLKNGSHEPTEVKLPKSPLKIYLSVLNPTRSLTEYVDLKLPTAGLAGILLNNKVTASFLEVVPGLPDLVSLGKLWFSLEHPDPIIGPDVVVLDAPATGHAIALIKSPANFKRITRMGPIYRDASLMTDFFSDPEKAAIALTTLPEEMSLQETKELKKTLSGFPEPFVFVNRCFPLLTPLTGETKESLPYQAYAYVRERGKRESEALESFNADYSLRIPFFFPDPSEPPLYQRISEVIQ